MAAFKAPPGQVSLHIFDTLDAGYAALSSDGGVSSDLFCSVVLLYVFFC